MVMVRGIAAAAIESGASAKGDSFKLSQPAERGG